MSFWNSLREYVRRIPKHEISLCMHYETVLQLATHAYVELSQPIEPRCNDTVGALLVHFWQDDPVVLLLIRIVLSTYVYIDSDIVLKKATIEENMMRIACLSERDAEQSLEMDFMREWQALVRQKTSHCPDDSRARYDAIVRGLRACLRHNMQKLEQPDSFFVLEHLFDGLAIGFRLRARDLSDVYCDMLMEARRLIAVEHEEQRRERLNDLHRKLCFSLIGLCSGEPIRKPSDRFYAATGAMPHNCFGQQMRNMILVKRYFAL